MGEEVRNIMQEVRVRENNGVQNSGDRGIGSRVNEEARASNLVWKEA